MLFGIRAQRCFETGCLKSSAIINGVRRITPRRSKSVQVYRSVADNPFVNLAFEDWVHENIDHENTNTLFLWRNKPTVVIGRHQNPWKECNLEIMKSQEINLVRRKSGGGTVYHDHGNINCTFFTDRADYNRKRNLEFLANFLRNFYDFDVTLNERDDLVLQSRYKISGTAAKLGLKKAYHHCTLLCNVDTSMLDSVLEPNYTGIDSNATKSVRSKTKNLFTDSTSFNWEEITTGLAKAFVQQHLLMNKAVSFKECFNEVDPLLTSQSQNILQKKNYFLDWDWNYGKTPKFSFQAKKQFPFATVNLKMVINKGLISEIDVDCNNSMLELIISKFVEKLVGIRFERFDILAVLSYQLSNNYFSNFHGKDIIKDTAEWIDSLFH